MQPYWVQVLWLGKFNSIEHRALSIKMIKIADSVKYKKTFPGNSERFFFMSQYSILDARCSMLKAQSSMLKARCSMLFSGISLKSSVVPMFQNSQSLWSQDDKMQLTLHAIPSGQSGWFQHHISYPR